MHIELGMKTDQTRIRYGIYFIHACYPITCTDTVRKKNLYFYPLKLEAAIGKTDKNKDWI